MIVDPVVQSGLERLNALLPLAARQQELDDVARGLHRAVLRHFVTTGGIPPRAALVRQAGEADVDAILAALAERDLIVLGRRGEILGAYPVTTECTPHRIQVNGQWIQAMCAVDAMAVAPMYDVRTRVESVCHVSGAPVTVEQHGDNIVAPVPTDKLCVGIRWQDPGQCAAHSLCREMVFLADATIADQWAQTDPARCSLFSVAQAIALARAFFRPLVSG